MIFSCPDYFEVSFNRFMFLFWKGFKYWSISIHSCSNCLLSFELGPIEVCIAR